MSDLIKVKGSQGKVIDPFLPLMTVRDLDYNGVHRCPNFNFAFYSGRQTHAP